jgi:pimeloyl-ACP methyl ester carboxylesterase
MKIRDLNFNIKIEGEGIPFIWGHGLTLNMKVEDTLNLFRWSEINSIARVIRYDARGHGLSDATFSAQDYVWSNLAKDMLGIADNCDVKTFVAGGQSMGCATAINAAILSPGRVKALVLVNPTTAWESRPEQAFQYQRNARIASLLGPGKLASAMRRVPEGLMPLYIIKSVGERINVVYESMNSFDRDVLVNIYEGAALSDLPPRSDISLLKIPVLILAWERDKVHPLESAHILHRLLPRSELLIASDISGVDRWPDKIRTFLKQQS